MAALVALAVASCATSQQREEELIRLRNDTLADMRTVKPHIKPEHMELCKKLLQQKKTIMGDSFRVVADFTLSVRHSCAARRYGVLFPTKTYPTAVYVTMIEQFNSDGESTALPKQGACAFKLESEEIEVFVSRTSGARHDLCHHI